MKYLRSPNQFQLRLGWLTVISRLVGDTTCPRNILEMKLTAQALGRNELIQSRWLAEADIGSPMGKLSSRAVPEIVRMAVTYGIYDVESQVLTDLGHVLLAVTNWTPGVSPFIWDEPARFIGIRVLLGANGDIILEILRRFPQEALLGFGQASGFLCECLESLATRTSDAQSRHDLTSQLDRARNLEFSDRINRTLVYPHFEPLRELGYLSVKKGGYEITERGRRFAQGVGDANADELLVRGLSRAFGLGEGIAGGELANAEDLRMTLANLPPALLGAHSEAPLEALVLLTQARFLRHGTGRWIDVRLAARIFRRLERDTAGKIGLKSGRARDEPNITWRQKAYLNDIALWSNAISDLPSAGREEPDPPSVASTEESESNERVNEGHLATPPKVSMQHPEKEQELDPAPVAGVVSEADPVISKDSNIVEPDISDGSPSPPSAGSIVPTPQALLWLSFVERLLMPPGLGDVGGLRRGGPLAWIASLRKLLEMPEDKLKGKRSGIHGTTSSEQYGNITVATMPLRKWLDRAGGVGETRGFAECSRAWSPKDNILSHVDSLRGNLLWAETSAARLALSVAEVLRRFVSSLSPTIDWESWAMVRELTRGAVDDALQLGLWHAPELLATLGDLFENDPASAAVRMIEELTIKPLRSSFDFTQEFTVPSGLVEILGELGDDANIQLDDASVELSVSESLTYLSVSVTLKARTAEQASSRGAEYAAEAVSRLAFLSNLRLPFANVEAGTIRPRDDGRLIDKNGALHKPLERREAGIFFERPEDLGIRQVRPIDNRLLGVVQKLPALAAIDRGVALDGRARLARSLHWLALADAPLLRPAERLSHGWVAFEHLFWEGEQKGHLVAELASPVVILCFIRSAGGRLFRDCLAALHVAACREPHGALQGLIERWLGAAFWPVYSKRGPGSVVPLSMPLEIDDSTGMRRLLGLKADYETLASSVEKLVPLVAWQIRELERLLATKKRMSEWLIQRQSDSANFLTGVYEVRNQLVHDANPFGFDDAYRLHNLYERYRVTINPVVAEVLRLAGADSAMPLKHSWSLLRARYGELLAQQKHGAAGTVDIEGLLECLPSSAKI